MLVNAEGNTNKNLFYCHCNLTQHKEAMQQFFVKAIPAFNFYFKGKLFKQTESN